MYTTCLHCHSSLGQNEAIEHFQVGRRLAFDAAKGRLWVVCGKCRRWNLTPLEERWEAIEECERTFSLTRARVASDDIALSHSAEGLELVRVGAPKLSEFAAWRYGSSLHKRWKTRGIPWAMVPFAGYGLQVAMQSHVIGVGPALAAMLAISGTSFLLLQRWGRVKLRLPDGRVVTVRHSMGNDVRLLPDSTHGWALNFAGKSGADVTTGTTAVHGLRGVLTSLNFFGGKQADIQDATDVVGRSGDPRRFLEQVASVSARHNLRNIGMLPPDIRLGLEMALHEDSERRALEGELMQLRDEWRLAEEIAQIADDMFIPVGVSRAYARLKTVARLS
jgi:hypothetical protein